MRLFGVAAIVLTAFWFGLVDNNWLDRRPAKRILYLGHSLTYYNDMPAMVEKMADSADSPVRYDIVMQAFPNASLEDHWRSRKTRQLLKQGGWDRVILQPERRYDQQAVGSGQYDFATRLLTGASKERPAIVISWLPEESWYRHRNYAGGRVANVEILQGNLRGIAYATDSDVIDIGTVWDQVRADELPFTLYSDGNHPSLEGSYLAALVVYAALSHDDVSRVTYVPWRMNGADAELLRERVQSALAAG